MLEWNKERKTNKNQKKPKQTKPQNKTLEEAIEMETLK